MYDEHIHLVCIEHGFAHTLSPAVLRAREAFTVGMLLCASAEVARAFAAHALCITPLTTAKDAACTERIRVT